MREVQAIIFDLDNTLWDVGPVILRAEHAMERFLAERYPRVLERHTLDSMRDVRARMALEHPAMRHDFTWLRTQALLAHASEAGYPDEMAHEAFEVFYRARNEVVLYDDVLPALTRLSGRYRLFAISNGNADLAAIGLAHFFERSLAAREAGMLKPDPRIFAMLLESARVPAERTIHIGDDPEADVEGARRAGVRPVWLNREGAAWPASFAAPEQVIASLLDLVRLLDASA
ncbi:MAG: HAD family hydrolase [Gammaproteobacteria bacterium]|nr:HAD family hydrolase [Gammaproteobacteria bacterium]